MLHLGLILGGSPAFCLPLQQDRSVLTAGATHLTAPAPQYNREGRCLSHASPDMPEPCRLHRKSPPIPIPLEAVAFPGTLVALRTRAAQGFAQKTVPNAGPPS